MKCLSRVSGTFAEFNVLSLFSVSCLRGFRQRIFEPVRMHNTFYEAPPEKQDRIAAVYSPSGPGQSIELSLTCEYSSEPFFGSAHYVGVAGLFSTASDYWRFSQMFLNGGELDGVRSLSLTAINLMISNHN